jgi:hypothetical protein
VFEPPYSKQTPNPQPPTPNPRPHPPPPIAHHLKGVVRKAAHVPARAGRAAAGKVAQIREVGAREGVAPPRALPWVRERARAPARVGGGGGERASGRGRRRSVKERARRPLRLGGRPAVRPGAGRLGRARAAPQGPHHSCAPGLAHSSTLKRRMRKSSVMRPASTAAACSSAYKSARQEAVASLRVPGSDGHGHGARGSHLRHGCGCRALPRRVWGPGAMVSGGGAGPACGGGVVRISGRGCCTERTSAKNRERTNVTSIEARGPAGDSSSPEVS